MANGADSGAGNAHRNACVAQAPAGTQRARPASNLEFTPLFRSHSSPDSLDVSGPGDGPSQTQDQPMRVSL